MKKRLLSNIGIILILSVLFTLWLLLLDGNNMSSLRNANREIGELKEVRDYYQSLIDADSAVIVGLQDSAYLEKFARETYFYTREDEKLYLLER